MKACESLAIDATREYDRSLMRQAPALHPLVDSVNATYNVLDQAIHTNPPVVTASD